MFLPAISGIEKIGWLPVIIFTNGQEHTSVVPKLASSSGCNIAVVFHNLLNRNNLLGTVEDAVSPLSPGIKEVQEENLYFARTKIRERCRSVDFDVYKI